jgi:hypothetical protein
MSGFSLHPNVYATGPMTGLVRMLEHVWVRDHTPGHGTFYVVSGFGNYNGGVRFYETFRDHIARGGRIVSFFAGSTRQRLTSRQLVEQMLEVGAEVNVINRKRLLHAKVYGSSTDDGDRLVVTSGNFTGPGMSQNVEAALMLDRPSTGGIGFSWREVYESLLRQAWDRHVPTLADRTAPVWGLLYDEYEREVEIDLSEEITLVVTLSHSDTARIQAAQGTNAFLGSQYFWLSRDSYGFFPPLTIRNDRGTKATFSCLIDIHYVDLAVSHRARVTFEQENNVDFRLGTGQLRGTGIAEEGDMAVISRTSETDYELRIAKRGTPLYTTLLPYATTFIGNRGKRYGYLDNDELTRLTGIRLPSVPAGGFA